MSANRLAALTGLAFIVLAVISALVTGEEPPNPSDDPVPEIIRFYNEKDTEIWIAAWLSGLGSRLAGLLRGIPRQGTAARLGPGHMLSSVVLAGATIVALAAAFDAAINIALVETADDIQPAAVQSLSALWSNDWPMFVVGAAIFALAAGLSIVRHGGLPRWMGWFAILLAVIAVTPLGFVGFLGTGLWIAIASVMLALRADEPDAPDVPPSPPPAPTTPSRSARVTSPRSAPVQPGRLRLLGDHEVLRRVHPQDVQEGQLVRGSRSPGRSSSCRSARGSSSCASAVVCRRVNPVPPALSIAAKRILAES